MNRLLMHLCIKQVCLPNWELGSALDGPRAAGKPGSWYYLQVTTGELYAAQISVSLV